MRSELVDLGEVKLDCLRLDPQDIGVSAKKPLVVFVHGFPDLNLCWKEQMKTLARAGHPTIAPNMRGYGLSSCPSEVEAYSTYCLTNDIRSLMEKFGFEKAHIVGHDWGGHVVWSLVLHYPESCLSVTSLNTPLSSWEQLRPVWEADGSKGPMEYLAKLSPDETGELDYQLYFNLREIPERELDADPEKTLNSFFRSQVHATREEDIANMKLGMRTAKPRKNNNRGVLYYAAKEIPRDPLWSEAELQTYVQSFKYTGFGPALNWYRNIDANIEWDHQEKVHSRKIQVPCLMVTAEHDVVLSPEASRGMERHFENLSRAHVFCGHWSQRERTKEINEILLGFISSLENQFISKI